MSTKLKENQLLAIPLVAQGVSGKDIASRLKVAEETVSRWKKIKLELRLKFSFTVPSLFLSLNLHHQWLC